MEMMNKILKKLRGCLWRKGINGLGIPLRIKGKVYMPWLPYRKRFDWAARSHDAHYDIQGGAAERWDADKCFLIEMLNSSFNDLQILFAMFYYIIERLLGWAFYRYNR